MQKSALRSIRKYGLIHFQIALTGLLIFIAPVLAQQTKSDGTLSRSAPVAATNAAPVPTPAEAKKIAEVLAFEKEMEAAVVRGDVAYLNRVLSKDFLFTHGDGWTTGSQPLKVDTKQTWLQYVSQQPPPYLYRTLDSVQVELHGDIAITYGRYLYQPRSVRRIQPPVICMCGSSAFMPNRMVNGSTCRIEL